jgi:hypothetical protein
VDGRAFVPIDAALADVIDLRGGYRVFVTPEGDSRGLYVVKGARAASSFANNRVAARRYLSIIASSRSRAKNRVHDSLA